MSGNRDKGQKRKTLKYLLGLGAASAYLGFASPASALLIHDAHELGYVNNGVASGDADRTAYVDHLSGMSLGATDSGNGPSYFRSSNDFGSLATAAFALNGSTTSIDLGSGLYTYLFAKYNSPNSNSEVWYVGDLSGIIKIPASSGGYGLSGWTLFAPGGSSQVPEGGSTLILLGLALAGIAFCRTKIRFA